MHKFRRYLNQNRIGVLIIIGIIVGVILIIRVLNSLAGQRYRTADLKEGLQNTNNESAVYKPNKTVLSNTTISDDVAEENSELIDEFIEYCNNNEIDKAYSLLTDECKDIYYNNVNDFKENYVNEVFNKEKSYNIQSWVTYNDMYTYKVRFVEDLMSTGKSNLDAIQDYITIVNENGDRRLNINSYVGRKEIDKQVEKKNIVISIEYKDIYIDKEEYCINVNNKSDNVIMIDSLNTTKGIKILGSNGASFNSVINELGENDVTVPSDNTKIIKIKFNKEHNKRKIEQIIFSDVVLDKEKLKEGQDEDNRTSINLKI